MVCYIVPATVAILGFVTRKKFNWKDKYSDWFNLLFLGGALFGIIDHLWNNELFLISENWVMDLLLGIAITAVILAAWAVFVYMDKTRAIRVVKT